MYKIFKLISLALIVSAFSTNSISPAPAQLDYLILGTWKRTSDTNEHWVFNANNELDVYYNNVLTESYSYSIKHYCNDINTNSEHHYLWLEHSSDTDRQCSSIGTLSTTKLSLIDPEGKVHSFIKQ